MLSEQEVEDKEDMAQKVARKENKRSKNWVENKSNTTNKTILQLIYKIKKYYWVKTIFIKN